MNQLQIDLMPSKDQLQTAFPDYYDFELISVRIHDGIIFPDSFLTIYRAETKTFWGKGFLIINYFWDSKLLEWVLVTR